MKLTVWNLDIDIRKYNSKSYQMILTIGITKFIGLNIVFEQILMDYNKFVIYDSNKEA